MKCKADSPEKILTAGKFVAFDSAEELSALQLSYAFDAESFFGYPEHGLNVSEAAGIVFQIRLQHVNGILVIVIPVVLFFNLCQKKILRSPEIRFSGSSD